MCEHSFRLGCKKLSHVCVCRQQLFSQQVSNDQFVILQVRRTFIGSLGRRWLECIIYCQTKTHCMRRIFNTRCQTLFWKQLCTI